MRLSLVLFVFTLLATSTGQAFHEGVSPCEGGEMGYIATMVNGERVWTFLSTTDPPSADAILCNLHPRQLVKAMPLEKES